MADIGVFVIHGMGTQGPNFREKFEEKVTKRLRKIGTNPARTEWSSGYWADILAEGQSDIWRRSRDAGRMDWEDIRRFVLDSMGDAVAYRRTDVTDKVHKKTAYERVHDRILERLELQRASLGNMDKPLIVVAHSLGSIIMSDYIWNAQKSNDWAKGKNDFVCMRTLCGLITFGSTLPLFSVALSEIKAIEFPPRPWSPAVPDSVRRVAEWNNYYDRDDVLGWPIKNLSESYKTSVTRDREIDVGSWWKTRWNPASHSEYWEDDDFTDAVANQIRQVLNAIPAAPSPLTPSGPLAGA